jgi:hypothetical protein
MRKKGDIVRHLDGSAVTEPAQTRGESYSTAICCMGTTRIAALFLPGNNSNLVGTTYSHLLPKRYSHLEATAAIFWELKPFSA